MVRSEERKDQWKKEIQRDGKADRDRKERSSRIGRLYGGSLYELAVEEGMSDKMAEQVEEMRDIFRDHPAYLTLLKEPAISVRERMVLIDQTFDKKMEPYLIHFIKILCERNLLGDLINCLEEFLERYKREKGIVEGIVTSPFSLTEEQMEAFEKKLSRLSGRKIRLAQRLDSGLLAGIKVSLDGKEYDGTVAGRLEELADRLEQSIL